MQIEETLLLRSETVSRSETSMARWVSRLVSMNTVWLAAAATMESEAALSFSAMEDEESESENERRGFG